MLVDVVVEGVAPRAGKSFGSRPSSLVDDTDGAFPPPPVLPPPPMLGVVLCRWERLGCVLVGG